MARGSFVVTHDVEADALRFEIAHGDLASVPDAQLALLDELTHTIDALADAAPDDREALRGYRGELLVLAKAGLEGDRARPDQALRALEVFREQLLTREGARLRRRDLRNLGLRAAALGLPALLAALVQRSAVTQSGLTDALLFVWAGCMAGIWLSFGARRPPVRVDDLRESARCAGSWRRLLLVGCGSLAVGVLFATRILAIGPLQTWRLIAHPEIALLIGLVCGFAERLISSRRALPRPRASIRPYARPSAAEPSPASHVERRRADAA